MNLNLISKILIYVVALIRIEVVKSHSRLGMSADRPFERHGLLILNDFKLSDYQKLVLIFNYVVFANAGFWSTETIKWRLLLMMGP